MTKELIESLGRAVIALFATINASQTLSNNGISTTALLILNTIIIWWIISPTATRLIKRWKKLNEPQETKVEEYGSKKK